MKSESDAAKLDELKRLLRRLDKALPQSPADEAQALDVRSRSARAGATGQGNVTALRTIALAGGVSLVVSLAAAILVFHDTPVRRLVAMNAPDDLRQPPAQRDESSAQGLDAPGRETAAVEASQPELQAAPHVARQVSGEVATPLPSTTGPTETVREPDTLSPPMETGGVAEAESSAPAALDAMAPQPADSPPAGGSAAQPAEKPDTHMQSDANRGALVELDAAQFMRRGLLMLSRGSVSAAQLLLERAADLGSGDAAFALASTYDGAPGAPRHGPEVRPNADLALRWYTRAQELGIDEARKRLAELKSGDDASGR